MATEDPLEAARRLATALTDDQILKVKNPEDLFGSLDDQFLVREVHRRLMTRLFPKTGVDSPSYNHMHHLWGLVLNYWATGATPWTNKHAVALEFADAIKHLKVYETRVVPSFGTLHITGRNLWYVVDESNADLFKIWQANLKKVLAVFEKEEKYRSKLPGMYATLQQIQTDKLADGSPLIRFTMPEGYLSLETLLKKMGHLSPEHVAWIQTRLHGLAIIMDEADAPNLWIGPSSIWIHPVDHDLIVPDGWQFASSFNRPAVAIPERLMRLVPSLQTVHTPTGFAISAMLKLSARTLLGDSVGFKYPQPIPKAMKAWAINQPHGGAASSMRIWVEARKASFPDHRFTPWTGISTLEQLYAS